MKIVLKKLSLLNFKGIRQLSIEFKHITNVHGANEAGKTTIFDAFLFLFFGKDSTDRKDFEVKTLDSRGKVIPKIEHEVCGEIEVDGESIVLKRIIREKWTKKRNATEAEFTGNETVYYWNEVPMKMEDYQAKINDLVKEGIFKLLTNTLYFNNLDWQKRRSALMQLAGDITDNSIAEGDTEFKSLLVLLGKKTFDEYKREIAAKKKKIKEELEQIPTRIDEANRSIPDPKDFVAIRALLATREGELQIIEQGIADESKAFNERNKGLLNKQQEIAQLTLQRNKIVNDIKASYQEDKTTRERKIATLKANQRSRQDELNQIATDTATYELRIGNFAQEQATLREEWKTINASVAPIIPNLQFNDHEFTCPTCKRLFEATDIQAKKDEMQKNHDESKALILKNFNDDKVKKLADNVARGKKLSEDIKVLADKKQALIDSKGSIETALAAIVKDVAILEAEITRLNENESFFIENKVANNADHSNLNAKIKVLESEMDIMQRPDTKLTDELKEKKNALIGEINDIRSQLNVEAQIKAAKDRISQLQDQERNLAQQIADLDGTEYTMSRFERAKSDALEAKVNGMFKYARFKLFETQINGAEVACCNTTYKGVPFSDLNTAGKALIGIDIINTLSAHYGISAPIFIDNRESISAIPESESQIINLIVSPKDKQLRVA